MRQFLFLCLSAAALGQMAVAGDISGKLPSGSTNGSSQAVVWAEGVKRFSVPTKKLVLAQHKGEFEPRFMVVVAGQTVEMPNEDLVAHNVYSNSRAKSFDLGYYAQGEHKEVTFEHAGLVELGCSIHKFMHAQILVVPNPYFATVNADGSFQISGLPAGNYVLKLRDSHEREIATVAVPSSGTAEVRVASAEAKTQRGKDGIR